MAEGGGGGGGETKGSRRATAYEAVGGRQRFTVELRPGETKIVSWRRFLKEAAGPSNDNAPPPSKADNSTGSGRDPSQSAVSADQPLAPPLASHPSLDARLAPEQVLGNDGKEVPPVSRLSTVIERIERLYVGKASSDEEDINDVVPDDDEYDTEDSFIDDTELNEYFQVDNSAIKHDGFFVNRGTLERISEATALPNQQPKKRRRKDLVKDDGSGVQFSNKDPKAGKKDRKLVPISKKKSVRPEGVVMPSSNPENVLYQNQMNPSEISAKKKSAATRTTTEAPSSGVPDGDSVLHKMDTDQQKVVVPSKLKEGVEFSEPSSERLNDRSSGTQGKSTSGRSLDIFPEHAESTQQRGKGVIQERPETSVPRGKNSHQVGNVPPIPRKEGSSRPKSTVLEKAIRDLEKLVSESRPPSVEVQDSDNNTSQAVKRRLPPEIKQKLAKVARLAQASHGKITKELLNRLMSIVGHMIQIRSLKRNLNAMVNMGLSAKQEKDDRVQQIKKEVAEMVSTRVPLINSKAPEQLAGTSDDFQESNPEQREAFKRTYSMDDALEDKICYLYDLYVEGLEEDAGPQVRKLYAELAALWPSGVMDNHGIKRAICRAKDRRRALQSLHKDQEKIKKKAASAPKTEETVRVEANSLAQLQYPLHKLLNDENLLATGFKSASNATDTSPTVRMPASVTNGPNTDRRPKQEKVKGSSSSSSDTKGTDGLPTKKAKRKPEAELMAIQGEERHKSQKQVDLPLPKSNLQLAAASTKISSLH